MLRPPGANATKNVGRATREASIVVAGGPDQRRIGRQSDTCAEEVPRRAVVRQQLCLTSPRSRGSNEHVSRSRVDARSVITGRPDQSRICGQSDAGAKGSFAVTRELGLLHPCRAASYEHVRRIDSARTDQRNVASQRNAATEKIASTAIGGSETCVPLPVRPVSNEDIGRSAPQLGRSAHERDSFAQSNACPERITGGYVFGRELRLDRPLAAASNEHVRRTSIRVVSWTPDQRCVRRQRHALSESSALGTHPGLELHLEPTRLGSFEHVGRIVSDCSCDRRVTRECDCRREPVPCCPRRQLRSLLP